MELLLLPLAIIFGLLLGSFLNVCIYRIPRDLSVVAPRSFCPECGRQLAVTDNIPIFSYLFLRGRCRYCSQPIGARYPLIELATAVLFALTAIKFGPTLAALKWAIFECLLIVLFSTDLEERLLPDELTLGGATLGLIAAAVVPVPGALGAVLLVNADWRWQSLLNATIGALLLAVPVWTAGVLYGRLRKREALGLGDVKLLVLLGVFLGPELGLSALMIGAVGGALLGILFIFLARKDASSYELPFGSFLCFGAVLVPFAPWAAAFSLAVP